MPDEQADRLHEIQFRAALETRNFEISLFWQHSNYFLIPDLEWCAQLKPTPQAVFEDPTAPLSRIRYTERDLLSLNESCPVTGARLSPAIPPVYTNGRPIGFC